MFINDFGSLKILVVSIFFLPIYANHPHKEEEKAKWSARKYVMETAKAVGSGGVSIAFAINAFRNYQTISAILSLYNKSKPISNMDNDSATSSDSSNLILDYNRLFSFLKRNKRLSLDAVNLVGSVYLCFKTGLYSLNKCSEILGL